MYSTSTCAAKHKLAATRDTESKSTYSGYNNNSNNKEFSWTTNVVVLCLCFFSACNMIVFMYYQYTHDLSMISLKMLRQNSSAGSPSIGEELFVSPTEVFESLRQTGLGNASESERELFNRIEVSKMKLRLIGGSDNLNSLTIQMVYLFMLIVNFASFCLAHLYFRYVTPFDAYQIREQLDYTQECKLVEEQVEEVVAEYCLLDKLFAKFRNARLFIDTSFKIDLENKHFTTLSSCKEALLDKRYQQLNTTGPLLGMMLTSGALVPANRYSHATCKRTILIFVVVIFMLLFSTIILYATLYATRKDIILFSRIEVCSGFVLIQLIFASALILADVCVFLDESEQVNQVLELFDRCIRVNSAEFVKHLGACRGKTQVPKLNQVHRSNDLLVLKQIAFFEAKAEAAQTSKPLLQRPMPSSSNFDQLKWQLRDPLLKMNANLLFTLMHYKMFVRQLGHIIKTFNPIVFIGFLDISSIPFIYLIHMSYMKAFYNRDDRFILVGISALSLFLTDLQIGPVCYFNARCKRLYLALSSLVAHIVGLEISHPGHVYDEHTALTILRELRNELSDQFIDKFTLQFLGVNGTYATLVEVHFWWGLMIIGILLGARPNGAGTFDWFLRDPFGVLSE